MKKLLTSVRARIMLLTCLVIIGVQAAHTGWMIAEYPELDLSTDEICGTNDENMTGLSRDGNKLTAQQNETEIMISLPKDWHHAVYEADFKVGEVSRMNCYAYMYMNVDDYSRQGSVIMAAGDNYITFSGADPSDRPTEIRYIPIPLRGVSFTLEGITLNPRLHFVETGARTAAFLLLACLLLELILFSVHRYIKTVCLGDPAKKHYLCAILLTIACVLQTAYSVFFAFLYLTSDWSWYAMVYYFAGFAAESLLVLAVFSAGKREVSVLRITLLSIWCFCAMELMYSDMFILDRKFAILQNLLVYALPFAVLWIPGRIKRLRKAAYVLPLAFWTVFALINHYYFAFREQAIELSDFSMAQTAKNVIGQYSLSITSDAAFVLIGVAVMVIALLCGPAAEGRTQQEKTQQAQKEQQKRIQQAQKEQRESTHQGQQAQKKKLRLQRFAPILPAVIFSAFVLAYIPNSLPYVNLWNTNIGTKHNGYILSFLSFAQKTLQKPVPAGYSRQETEQKLASYDTKDQKKEGVGSTQAVNIIVMMNEAFSDLPTTYGFDTDVDDMPFIHSLSGSNVRKGNLLVSVFGGTTADTEYEFLTGSSMAFLNSESVPYTQYIDTKLEAMPWLLKSRGYETLAFHPFLESGYKRYKVYPLMGFDDFISSEDAIPYMSRMRSYVSDASDVKDIIDLYENRKKEGEPFFLFNVTMQNHGGYNEDESAVDVTVNPTDEDLQLPQLQEYLSLVKATDSAFEQLVEYFQNVDEKTIILMFGDHQPGMDESVYKKLDPAMYEENASLSEKEKKYTVPYTMWANYDLTSEELPVTSPGFLKGYLLENAGVEKSAYDALIADVRKDYPAMNVFGFMDSDGKMHSLGELDSVKELSDYKKAAYYLLFGHEKVKSRYFE
ncbi:MAG: sulfatase-like hydrolase/transferase [Lachnospiraceae bacterium]|nr:sulfatase-like hydrolase/transferase [Lachnospiraceae bacterium]